MPVEFIGAVITNDVSETRSSDAPIDREDAGPIPRTVEPAGVPTGAIA